MQVILNYFPQLSTNQINQFSKLKDLYEYWNKKINVISRKDISKLYINHVLHSLAIAKIIEFTEGTKVIDVGTGGGFPGIPLAILFPKVEFLLVDSIGKKIKVVNEISLALKLKNVRLKHEKVENINETFDFVISRAVTNMRDFKRLVLGKLNDIHKNQLNNGILYLKGGDLSKELKGIKSKQFLIKNIFKEDFFKTKKVVYIKY